MDHHLHVVQVVVGLDDARMMMADKILLIAYLVLSVLMGLGAFLLYVHACEKDKEE